jgi:hypothetical protein
VDGYKNTRMVEHLGLTSLPALVELHKGAVVKKVAVSSLKEIQDFC